MDEPIATPHGSPESGRYVLGCGLGIGIAAVAIAVVFLGGHFATIDQTPAIAEKMGGFAGAFLLPLIGGSAVAGLAWIYRRWLGALLTTGVLVLALGIVGMLFAANSIRGETRERRVTAADRAPPVLESIDGEPVLVQRTVGLVLPSLVGFTYEANNAILAPTPGAEPEAASPPIIWRYSRAAATQQIVVSVDIGAQCSPSEAVEIFEAFMNGARNSANSGDVMLVRSQASGPLDRVLHMRLRQKNINLVTRVFAYTYRDAFVIAAVAAVGDESLERIAFAARALSD